MHLPIFKREYHAEKHKLRSLSGQRWEAFNQLIHTINHADELFYFSEDDRKALKQHNQRLQVMRDKLTQANTSSQLPPDNNSQTKLDALDWLQQQKQCLDKPETWEQFAAATTRQTQLEKCQQRWQQQSPTACWNNEAIVCIAHEVLPSLDAAVAQAKKELHKIKTPKQLFVAYSAYLNEFSTKLDVLRASIQASMLYRLQLNSNSGVIPSLIKELQQISCIKADMKVPTDTNPLTAEQFNQFHQFIFKHGNKQQRRSLLRLPWFQDNNLIQLSCKEQDNTVILIPSALLADIPSKPRRPLWLFKGHNLRYQFFKDKLHWFSQINFKPPQVVAEIGLSCTEQWQQHLHQLTKIQQQLNKALQQHQSRGLSLNRWWHGKTRRIIDAWQQQLEQAQQQVFQEKINTLAMMIEKLTQIPDTFNDIPWSSCQLMTELLGELLHQAKNKSRYAKHLATLTHFQEKMSTYTGYNRAVQILRHAKAGVSQNEHRYMTDVLEVLSCRPGDQLQQFKQLAKQELQVLPKHIMSALVTGVGLKKLSSQYQLMNLVFTQQEMTNLNRKIIKAFVRWLEAILLNTLSNSKLEAYETFFISAGGSLMITDKSLAEVVTSLQQVRQHHARDVLVIKARLLAQQLADKCLQRRFAKDHVSFEMQLQQAVKQSDPHINQQAMKSLETIRKQLVATNPAGYDDILSRLPKFQQSILKMGEGKVRQCLVVSAVTQYFRSRINSKACSYQEKAMLMRQARETAIQLIPATEQTTLFNKQFLSPRVIH